MWASRQSARWIHILMAVLVCHCAGCTVVGYSVGYRLDRSSRTDVPVECDGSALKEGSLLHLTLKDGSRRSGHLVERMCGEDPALVLGVQRRNYPDTTEKVRISTIERIELQRRDLTVTTTALGAVVDMALVVFVLEARSGIGGTSR